MHNQLSSSKFKKKRPLTPVPISFATRHVKHLELKLKSEITGILEGIICLLFLAFTGFCLLFNFNMAGHQRLYEGNGFVVVLKH